MKIKITGLSQRFWVAAALGVFVIAAAGVGLAWAFKLTHFLRTPEENRQRFLQYAKGAMEEKNYPGAIFLYKNAIKVNPQDPHTHYQLALAYLAAQDVRDAVNELKRATDLDPNYLEAQLKLANLYALTKNSELLAEAEKRTKSVLSTQPNSAEALETLAATEYKLGKPEDAVDHLQQAVQRAPESSRAPLALALIRLREGKAAEAEQIMQRAAERAPKSVETAIALGRFYLVVRKPDQAEASFRRALNLDHQNRAALLALGEMELLSGRKQEAGQTFQTLAALPDGEFKTIHATYLLEEGRANEAIAELTKISKADPTDRRARSQLISVYVAQKRMDDARKVLTDVLSKNRKDADALLQRAALSLQAGKPDDAEKDLQQVLQDRPDSAEAHLLMSKVHMARHSEENAKRELNDALARKPTLLGARLALGQMFLAHNDGRSAVELFDQTPAEQKQNLRVQVARNWALLTAGETDELKKTLARQLAVGRVPDFLMQDGVMKAKQNDFEGARASFQEVLKQRPNDILALEAVAGTYQAQNHPELAVKAIQQYAATAKGPAVARMQHFVGEWMMGTNDRAGARKAFETAKAADPRYVTADVALAQLDLADGKYDQARQRLKAAIALDGNRTDLRVTLAVVEGASGNRAAAISQYREVVRSEPGNVAVLNNLAYTLAEQENQLDEALKYASDAVREAPDQPAFLDTLGWIYYRKGMYQEAVQNLERAVSLQANARRKYHLAMAYFKAGDDRKGKETLNSAMTLDSNLPEAMVALKVQSDSTSSRR